MPIILDTKQEIFYGILVESLPTGSLQKRDPFSDQYIPFSKLVSKIHTRFQALQVNRFGNHYLAQEQSIYCFSILYYHIIVYLTLNMLQAKIPGSYAIVVPLKTMPDFRL